MRVPADFKTIPILGEEMSIVFRIEAYVILLSDHPVNPHGFYTADGAVVRILSLDSLSVLKRSTAIKARTLLSKPFLSMAREEGKFASPQISINGFYTRTIWNSEDNYKDYLKKLVVARTKTKYYTAKRKIESSLFDRFTSEEMAIENN